MGSVSWHNFVRIGYFVSVGWDRIPHRFMKQRAIAIAPGIPLCDMIKKNQDIVNMQNIG